VEILVQCFYVAVRFFFLYLGFLILSPVLKACFDLELGAVEGRSVIVFLPVAIIAVSCATIVYDKIEKHTNLVGVSAFMVMTFGLTVSYGFLLCEKSFARSGRFEPAMWPELIGFLGWAVWVGASITSTANNPQRREWE